MIIDFTIWDNKLLSKIENFKNNHSNITRVIVDSAIEYQYDFLAGKREHMDDLIQFTKEHNIELNIITGTHSNYVLIENQPHIKVHYWPTFWLSLLLTRLKVSPNYQMNMAIGLDVDKIDTGKKLPIKYPYISMNKAPKVHRAIMMDMLAKNEILDHGVVIWRELCTNYGFGHWNQEILLRDQKEGFKNQEILPLEYALSFAQLVPESDEQIFTMSEKTGMALYFNKPFLVAGCKGFHRIMKDMGFVWYDELFDYAFDEVDDIKHRYDLIAQNFKKYAHKSPNELKTLYASVFEKCVYNKKVALSLATSTKLVPNIWQDLVTHHIQNNIGAYPETINNFIITNENEYRL